MYLGKEKKEPAGDVPQIGWEPRADAGFEVRGGANGWEILKSGRRGVIVNISQIYDYHSIYISI